MFHTMFFISYKTSGRDESDVRLDEEPFVLWYFYSLLKYNREKQRERLQQTLAALWACGVDMVQ